MKRLYAPWRTKYTKNVAHAKKENITKEECVFCSQLAQDLDEENFIIRRFEYHAIVMNRYPYNEGHLLIITNAHKNNLEDLSSEERIQLMELINICTKVVKDELKADGINIGINLGKAAGAGIPSHLHVHILPRWQGDTNFLPLLADTKQVSVDLLEVYEKLKKAFQSIVINLQI
jgi:ATP adenylyltransferase